MSCEWWRSVADADFEPLPAMPDGFRIGTHHEIRQIYERAKKSVRGWTGHDDGLPSSIVLRQGKKRKISKVFLQMMLDAGIFVEGA